MKILLVPLILIIASLFVGYLGCILGTCFTTLPILGIVALVLAIFTIIIIFRHSEYSRLTKGLSLLIIPIYISGSIFVSLISMGVFQQQRNKAYEKQQVSRTEMAQKGIPEIGNISQAGSTFTYECIECKFKVAFPSNWQYRTELVDFTNKKEPYLTLRLLPDASLKMPDHPNVDDINISNKEIYIISYPSKYINHAAEEDRDDLYQKDMGYQIETININGINFRISKKLGEARNISENYQSIYAFAHLNNRKIIVKTWTGIPFDMLDSTTYDAFTKTLNSLSLF